MDINEIRNRILNEAEVIDYDDMLMDIENYCGDYGTLESRLEETLWLILDILKELKGSNNNE